MNNKLEIGIVGAGIQGISNALFLQKKVLTLQYLTEMNRVVRQPHTEMLVTFRLMHPYH